MAVYFNGRTAVHQDSRGELVTTSINLTGPLRKPIAYLNKAYTKDVANTSNTVFVNHHPICHKESYLSKSYGDEAGNHGGVNTGTINGKAYFLSASPNIFVEGKAVVRANDMMTSNCGNTNTAPLQQEGLNQATAPLLSPDEIQIQKRQSYTLVVEMNNNQQILETLSTDLF